MLFMCYVANVVQCDNHNTDTDIIDVYRRKGTDGVRGAWVSNHFQRAIIGRLVGASGREELHLSLTSGETRAAASIKVKG